MRKTFRKIPKKKDRKQEDMEVSIVFRSDRSSQCMNAIA